MRETALRTTTGLLLSAVMVFGSVVPPGQRHAHAGGNVAHDHHAQDAHDHSRDGHDHHALSDHGTERIGSSTEAMQPASAPHVHFACWLFDVTLPARDEAESDDDRPVCLVRLLDDCLPTTNDMFDTHSTVVAPLLPGSAVTRITPTRRANTPPDTRILLCDAARHERSGVQLF